MIRPILFETSSVNAVDMWAFISVHLALYGIFLFASWLICKQSMTEKRINLGLVFLSVCGRRSYPSAYLRTIPHNS